jgi:aspartate aminotransferase
MFGLSQRVKEISPSPTLVIDTMIKELVAQGENIINLSVGEPDTDTPMKASYRAIEGIVDGFTKYTNSSGIIELRRSLANKFRTENDLHYDIDQIIVSVGGKHSLYNAFMALCNPGDEVILPAPYWVSYPEQIKLAGAVPVIVDTDESTNFKLTPAMLEAAITNKTKAIVLTSPSNPTGSAYSEAELRELASIISRHEFYIISDEIYEKLVYNGSHHSIANISEEIKNRTLIVNGFSKTYGMTGWRLGYTAGPKDVIKAMSSFQSHVTSNPTSIAQLAAIGALEDYDPRQKAIFQERLEYVYKRVNEMKHIACLKPDGAFYVFPNVKECIGRSFRGEPITSSERLCELILDNAKVGIVSGTGFGSPNNVRISYALNLDKLTEAMNRLEAFLEEVR